jgi:hypothetical protein
MLNYLKNVKLAKKVSISGNLFQDQATLTIVNKSNIHIRARTRLLTECQKRWNNSNMGRYCLFNNNQGFRLRQGWLPR